jgi:alpha-beta hydrolase superfamily lysophospholipase
MTFDSRFDIASPTGATLNAYVREAGGSPRGIVQVAHGLAEHAERYGRFAAALAANGFHVIAHDHRGHGHTRAPDAPAGVFAGSGGAERVVADMMAVNRHARQTLPGLPLVLFGHSMGGLIAMNTALRHPDAMDALAVWNANFSAGALGRVAQGLLAWERFRLGSDVPSRLLPALTFRAWARKVPDRRTEFDWLSRDPAEVDKYVADPLCGWDASVSMWRDLFDLVFYGADDRNFGRLPRDIAVSLAGGAHDPATDGGKAVSHLERRMKGMGFSRLSARVYADTRHEGLNEVNRDAITADFLAWLDQAVPAR